MFINPHNMKKLPFLLLILISACTDQFSSGTQDVSSREAFSDGRVQTCIGMAQYTWKDNRAHTNYPTINPTIYYYDVEPVPYIPSANGCIGISTGTVTFHFRNGGAIPITVGFNNNKVYTKTVQPGQTWDFSMPIPPGLQIGGPIDKVRAVFKLMPQCTTGVFAHQITWDISGTPMPQYYWFNNVIPPSGQYQNTFGWGATYGTFTCP